MAINKKFVIVSLARSGSNLLVSMLNGHPQIICEGELFNALNLKRKRSAIVFWLIINFPMLYLAKRLRTAAKTQKPVYGFKLLVSQWPSDISKGLMMLKKNNFQCLFLFRRNKIAQLLSLAVARQVDKWVVRSKKEYNQQTIELDLSIVERAMKEIEYNLTLYHKLKEQYCDFEILYEEDLLLPDKNGPKIAQKMADFLSIENHPLNNYTLKTDPRSDSERISNLDEFLAYCRNAGYTKEVDYYIENQQ